MAKYKWQKNKKEKSFFEEPKQLWAYAATESGEPMYRLEDLHHEINRPVNLNPLTGRFEPHHFHTQISGRFNIDIDNFYQLAEREFNIFITHNSDVQIMFRGVRLSNWSLNIDERIAECNFNAADTRTFMMPSGFIDEQRERLNEWTNSQSA